VGAWRRAPIDVVGRIRPGVGDERLAMVYRSPAAA
jgi:hypothetical protein